MLKGIGLNHHENILQTYLTINFWRSTPPPKTRWPKLQPKTGGVYPILGWTAGASAPHPWAYPWQLRQVTFRMLPLSRCRCIASLRTIKSKIRWWVLSTCGGTGWCRQVSRVSPVVTGGVVFFVWGWWAKVQKLTSKSWNPRFIWGKQIPTNCNSEAGGSLQWVFQEVTVRWVHSIQFHRNFSSVVFSYWTWKLQGCWTNTNLQGTIGNVKFLSQAVDV